MKYSCIIDKECGSDLWFGWISPLDDKGDITDELITRRCNTKKEAVDRLREMCHKNGYEGASAEISLGEMERIVESV